MVRGTQPGDVCAREADEPEEPRSKPSYATRLAPNSAPAGEPITTTMEAE